MTCFTHGQKTALGSGCSQKKDSGLTPEGKQVIRRMNELGVIVDLAHAGRQTALETIEVSNAPVIHSHTASKFVYDDADNRNIDDDHMRSLSKKEGLVGIYVWPRRLSSEVYPSFDDWFRHVEHAVKVAGVDHVAIGTDVTYLPNQPPQAMDWTNWPYWTVGLVCRGFSDEEIKKILGENFLRFAEKVMDKQPWEAFGP